MPTRLLPFMRAAPWMGAVAGMAVALVSLGGWAAGRPAVASWGPGLATQKPLTAAAVLAAGVALLLLARGRHDVGHRAGQAAAALVLVLAGASLGAYVMDGLGAGIDRMLFGEVVGTENVLHPGRMSVGTAVGLVGLALALLLLDREWSDVGALVPVALGLAGLLGQASAAWLGLALADLTTFSLPTSVALLALGGGTMFVDPDRGVTRALAERGPAGVAVRRAFAVSLIVPWAVAGAALAAVRSGIVASEVTLGLVAAVTFIALTLLSAVHVRMVERAEARRSQAARRSERSEARIRRLVERAPVGVFVLDEDWTVREGNGALAQMLGLDPADLSDGLRRTLWWDRAAPMWVASLRSSGSVQSAEVRLRTWDGEERWAQVTASRIDDPATTAPTYEGFALDVTEERALADQLRVAQKMEAVGNLAGGVAHDFNNMLSVINGNAELLLEGGKLDPEDAALVGDLLDAGSRGATLTSQLLTLGRRTVLTTASVELNRGLEGMTALLQRLLGDDITLIQRLSAGRLPVRMRSAQLDRIVVNLVVNARDAMPDGGILQITTERVHLGGAPSPVHPPAVGPHALLTVADTGEGMSEAVRSRIFEPFFTTKPEGRGTGLGLATVYGLVERAHGHVLIDSDVGSGTTFRIYLPLAEAAESAPGTAPAVDARPGDPGRSILLVDDREAARRLFRRMLEAAGLRVLEAATVAEAREVARRFGRPLDLLLVGTRPPSPSDAALATWVEEIHPGARVVFARSADADTSGVAALDRQALARTLEDVLARGAVDPGPH